MHHTTAGGADVGIGVEGGGWTGLGRNARVSDVGGQRSLPSHTVNRICSHH